MGGCGDPKCNRARCLVARTEKAEMRAKQLDEALRGLVQNIKMHHDQACTGITPSDCLDAIYEAADIARYVLEPI